MGNIGAGELIFIAIFALLVFGPKRLPEIGRSVGKALAEVRKATNELKEGFTSGFEDFNFDEIRELRDLTNFRDLKEPLILNGPIKATGGTGPTGASRQAAPAPPPDHPNQASLTVQASPSTTGEPAGSPGQGAPPSPQLGTSTAGTEAGPPPRTPEASGTADMSTDPGSPSTPGPSGEDGATRT